MELQGHLLITDALGFPRQQLAFQMKRHRNGHTASSIYMWLWGLLQEYWANGSWLYLMQISKENAAQYLYDFELSELLIREPRFRIYEEQDKS